MADDDLNYDDVIDVWEREKEAKLPCTLPTNFYERLRRYIQDLEDEIEDLEVPPKSKRGKRIQKQYRRVKKVSELFFKERQKKIILAAYHRSLGKSVETENLLEPELELLQEIATLLDELKNQVFLGEYKRKTVEMSDGQDISSKKDLEDEKKRKDTLQPEETREKDPEKTLDKGKEEEPSSKRKSSEDEISSSELSPDVASQDEILIHITEDVPSFVDIDATYDLKKEDVLTLREDLAKVLIERGKARKIKL